MPSITTPQRFAAAAPRLGGAGALAHGALAWLHRVVTAYAEWHANRRDFHRLLRMEDRLLRDIGLTREDVDNALSKPPWSDVD
ncbi:MAG: DUF1127 domain-containing protein [Pseudomonadota bacterium]